MLAPRLSILRPGTLPYERAFALQQSAAARVAGGGDATLILLEHPPTYTLGRRADAAHILATEDRLRSLGATVVHADRGGDVTFHGPGQLVAYAIVDLRRVGIGVTGFVEGLEECMIRTLGGFGITAGRSPLNRGAWVGADKVGAVGVRVSRGITTHGLALNVTTDLAWFSHIVPCGINGAGVTSMQRLTGEACDMDTVADELAGAFTNVFGIGRPELLEAAR